MIIIQLRGGLGNQMFQYACGTSIASRLGVKLKLDISYMTDKKPRENFTERDYALNVFNINNEIASKKEVQRFVPYSADASEFTYAWFMFKRTLFCRHRFSEPAKNPSFYFAEIEQITNNTYIKGYFQNEKYFNFIRDKLLKDFSIRNEIDDNNQNLSNKINSENAVSIHIRRGDYLNSLNASLFNLLDIDYYKKAIKYILKEVENPVFYVFTEDFQWAKTQFAALDIPITIVDWNIGSQSYLDMILMSRCKHNIIANSSFSWWGAWLNQYPEKKIIAPQNWFKNPKMNETHIIPSNWIKL
ncbi:MAG: alpha-1,2-fucosyltransferase [Paludibacter sp.]|nr:alpha-1,2-fucosyltransferase [Paludibacter sp.]